MEPMPRDDTIEINSPATIEGMRQGRTARRVDAARRRPLGQAGRLDPRAEPDRREVDAGARRRLRAARIPRFSRRASARASTTSSATASRRRRKCCATATSSTSTSLPSWTAITATRRSRTSSEKASALARKVVECARECLRHRDRRGRARASTSATSAPRSRRTPRRRGCSVVREYCGHGINRVFHTNPSIPHYGVRGDGPQMRAGMIFTIEPMINTGHWKTKLMKDRWTARTVDGGLSAQFEHTILVTPTGHEILTDPAKLAGKRVRPRRPARHAVRSGPAADARRLDRSRLARKAFSGPSLPRREPKAAEPAGASRPQPLRATSIRRRAAPGSGIFGLPTPRTRRVHLDPGAVRGDDLVRRRHGPRPRGDPEREPPGRSLRPRLRAHVRGRHRDASRGAAGSRS